MRHDRFRRFAVLAAGVLWSLATTAYLAAPTSPRTGSILETTLNFQDDPSVPDIDNLPLTSTTRGRYTSTHNNIGTTPPRQIGVTLRLDF